MTKSTHPSSGTGSSRTVQTSNSRGSRPMTKTGGFDSQIFTLIVGPQDEEKTFTAHASYLSQSPVFDRMCNGPFEESQTFKIRLPEDRPNVIEALIEYLYSGDFHGYGTTLSGENTKTASDQLAELYCVAEKYGLGDLKILVLDRLAAVKDVRNKIAEFLSVASTIYARTSDSDDVYRTFFKDQAGEMELPSMMSESDRQSLDECISAGSTLAIDIVDCISSKYAASLECVEAQFQVKTKAAREQIRELERKLNAETQRVERYKSRLNR